MWKLAGVCVRVGFVLQAACWLGSCAGGPSFQAEYEPWREAAERACLASGQVRQSAFLTPMTRLGGPGVCGALSPFEMSAAEFGRVRLRPAAVLRCPMVRAVDDWVREAVSPAALRHLGSPVVELTIAASYSCRPRNNIYGAKLSEHGLANAVDISAFVLADGRRISVERGWRGPHAEQVFLRTVHRSACQSFTTVLSPDADEYHRDHFHLDLARHNNSGDYRVCH
jgi:hypothetical protein